MATISIPAITTGQFFSRVLNTSRIAVVTAGGKFLRLFQLAAQDEDEGNDQAAEQERNAPAPLANGASSAALSAKPMAAATMIATCWLPDCQLV